VCNIGFRELPYQLHKDQAVWKWGEGGGRGVLEGEIELMLLIVYNQINEPVLLYSVIKENEINKIKYIRKELRVGTR
jgi:hypothetical protein